jgi:hypothetical protein
LSAFGEPQNQWLVKKRKVKLRSIYMSPLELILSEIPEELCRAFGATKNPAISLGRGGKKGSGEFRRGLAENKNWFRSFCQN